MFINFWYAAGRATEFTDQPLKRRMLGQDFVLFRDSQGIARVLSNTCTHRGGSLGGGKVQGDCIECPYHGWQFDGDGICHRIPSLGPNARIPARTRVDAYPTEERYGLVFAFLGDLPEAERPPILNIEEYGPDGPAEGWAATIQDFQWEIDYKRSIENGIDPAHNEFVHPTHGFSGNNPDYVMPAPKVDHTEWGTGFWSRRLAPPLAENKMREASGREDNAVVEGGTGHEGVSMIWTHIHPTPTMFIHQYLFETPIDAEHTQLYLVNLRNFLIDSTDDERMMTRNEVVALQDRGVLEDINPVQTPPTNNHEFFVGADEPIAGYREKIKDWEARGWRIDLDDVERNRKRVAYAIPCPARREFRNWVLDAIPLIAGSDAAASSKSGTAAD
ncbi:MAG: aromatic ring-hydroxylating dioxygenase subunit alpha [Gammaproteobacteria bacterium]|nr:aromatic ring-hydroxylating dioxygenase subunit alpha [Gammaproteobacteria bacterium]